MERFSLKQLFHIILRNVAEQKEKENQELLAAELQWEQCCDEINLLEKDKRESDALSESLQAAPAQYDDLFTQKEKLIAAGSIGSSALLLTASEKLSKKKGERNEIREAIEVGDELKKQLEVAGQYLNSASNWGTWDLLGGGIISTAIKRGKMDTARDAMQSAQHLLNQFNKELGDINTGILELPSGGFSSFADYFFDCLIVDWLVQSSINKAFGSVSDLYEKVKEVNSRLLKSE